jgi:LmbE family N-acetylglucosaminyl deacetylase
MGKGATKTAGIGNGDRGTGNRLGPCFFRPIPLSPVPVPISRSRSSPFPLPLSPQLRVISAVYAHPDDETFSGGGTFARYAGAGVRCTLYCATDGDAGKTSSLGPMSKEALAKVRRAELCEAATTLGFKFVESAGHRDGGLGALDQQVLIAEIVRHFRRERPDIVVTFGPEGAPNTHPDHRVISRATTAAFFLAANPSMFAEQLRDGVQTHSPARLFYVAWPTPAANAVLKTVSVPATVRIDVRRYREQELAAWRQHVSQHFLQQRFDETAATDDELFALAAGVPQPRATIEDFFEGL